MIDLEEILSILDVSSFETPAEVYINERDVLSPYNLEKIKIY